MVKVSVVLPVYNTGEYISQCLDSILQQTLKDFEIICVDDGSTDSSRETVERYASQDHRIRLYRQENQYAGVARNHGLRYAQGKYVVFWDSDDVFRAEALETLYLQSEKVQSDICICGADRLDNKTQKHIATDAYLRKDLMPDREVFNKHDIPDYIFNLATNVPWNKMFRREFLQKHGLYFQEIRQANDTYFTLMSLFYAERITSVEKSLISYRVNNQESLSGKASDTVFCAYYSYVYTWERMKKESEFPVVKRSLQNRAISGFYHAMNIQTSFEAYRQLYEKLVSEGFATFELLGKPEEFFYAKWMYDDMQKMLVLPPEEFLLGKSMTRRLTVEKNKSRQQKLLKKKKRLEQQVEELQKQVDILTEKLKVQENKNQMIQNTFSYRLGRSLTGPVRSLRQKLWGKH